MSNDEGLRAQAIAVENGWVACAGNVAGFTAAELLTAAGTLADAYGLDAVTDVRIVRVQRRVAPGTGVPA